MNLVNTHPDWPALVKWAEQEFGAEDFGAGLASLGEVFSSWAERGAGQQRRLARLPYDHAIDLDSGEVFRLNKWDGWDGVNPRSVAVVPAALVARYPAGGNVVERARWAVQTFRVVIETFAEALAQRRRRSKSAPDKPSDVQDGDQ